MVRLASVMVACFVGSNVSASVLVYLLSNAACNPDVLAMVRLSSVMVACFAYKAACNPVVLAMVRLASVMVACFVASNMSASVLVYLLSNAV